MSKLTIIDDNETRREGLKLLLSQMLDEGISEVQVLSIKDIRALEACPDSAIYLVAVDTHRSAVWTTYWAELLGHTGPRPIVCYSNIGDRIAEVFFRRNGASAYIVLDTLSALRQSLSTALNRPSNVSEIYGSAAEPHSTLNNRELQVLLAYASGDSTKEIAYQMNLSIKTICLYRKRILAKLGLRGTAEMATYVFDRGIDAVYAASGAAA